MGGTWGVERKRAVVRAIIGVVIAALIWLVYLFFAGISTGTGHGTYLPFFLLITPFGFGPAVWCAIGALAANVDRPRSRRILVLLLIAFYVVGLAWILIKDHEYYPYFPGGPGDLFAVIGIALVAIPHLWIWLRIADAAASVDTSS